MIEVFDIEVYTGQNTYSGGGVVGGIGNTY